MGGGNLHTHPFKTTFRGFGTERSRLVSFLKKSQKNCNFELKKGKNQGKNRSFV